MNRENQSDDILFDLLKTAGEIDKEAAPWKNKLLAPALGLGLGLGLSQVPKLAPQDKSQQQQTQTKPSDDSKWRWKVTKMEYRPWKEVQGEPNVCWITAHNNRGVELEARSMGHFWDTQGEGSCNVQVGDYVEGDPDDLLYTSDKVPFAFKMTKAWETK